MKLTRTSKRASGMTLLELTVVILVLLSLISILFVGARAWKKGSDRSANIMNIRNVQQAVRGHQNMNGLLPGTAPEATDGSPLASTVIFGDNGYLKQPTPPIVGIDYGFMTTVPAVGDLYVTNPDLEEGDGEYFFTAAELDNSDPAAPGKISDW